MDGNIMIICLYEDGMIFINNNLEILEEPKKTMTIEYKMIGIGEICDFLCLKVKQSKEGIIISQKLHVNQILEKFNIATANLLQV